MKCHHNMQCMHCDILGIVWIRTDFSYWQALLVSDFGPKTALKIVEKLRKDILEGKLNTGAEIKVLIVGLFLHKVIEYGNHLHGTLLFTIFGHHWRRWLCHYAQNIKSSELNLATRYMALWSAVEMGFLNCFPNHWLLALWILLECLQSYLGIDLASWDS